MLNSKDMKTSSKILSTIIAVAILSTSAVTVFAENPTEVDTNNSNPVTFFQNIPASITSSDVLVVDNSSAEYDGEKADINEPSLFASGDLAAGKAYAYDSQYLAKGQKITINADWTPTGSSIQIGIRSSGGTVLAKSVSGGSGEVAYTINSSGNYSVYVANPSKSSIKFDVSYIVN